MNRSTPRLGLIGWPVGHSLSAIMHRAALAELGLAGTYELLSILPEALERTIRELAANGFTGVNVTIPHKAAVMPYLDDISLLARSVGAVNTILVRPDGRLVGENTDVPGLRLALAEAGIAVRDTHVLILGAGGAARAAVAAAIEEEARCVTIWARRPELAAVLIETFSAAAAQLIGRRVRIDSRTPQLRSAKLGAEALREVGVIINATSAGMARTGPHETVASEESPWPGDLPFPQGAALFDMVYNPRDTKLMGQARAAGLRPVINGLSMLVYQGAFAFRLWTGREAPIGVMKRSIGC